MASISAATASRSVRSDCARRRNVRFEISSRIPVPKPKRCRRATDLESAGTNDVSEGRLRSFGESESDVGDSESSLNRGINVSGLVEEEDERKAP